MRERITAEVKADAERTPVSSSAARRRATASDNAELLQRVSVAEQDAVRARQASGKPYQFFCPDQPRITDAV